MRASEVAQALNVPTVYIEEELELLAAGANGQYGCCAVWTTAGTRSTSSFSTGTKPNAPSPSTPSGSRW